MSTAVRVIPMDEGGFVVRGATDVRTAQALVGVEFYS